MQIASQILLLALPVTPGLGALLAGLLPSRLIRPVRALGWAFSIGVLGEWVALRAMLAGGDGLLVSAKGPWVAGMGIGVHLGLDSTGFILAGMIAFLGVVALVGTQPSTPELNRTHVVCLLSAEAGMLGVVASWDLILFVAFWEVTLLPFFFLMGRGGARGGVAAATRFVITSVISSVLMWVGVLWLVQIAGEPWTFDLEELAGRLGAAQLPLGCFWLMALTFLMRMAAFGLHTWLPEVSVDVPTAANVLLAGGVLPLGGFGFVHILQRLFPPDLLGMSAVFTWIGLATALCGGLASVVQRDLKRLLSYACLAQVGLALAGLSLGGADARQGGLMMLVAAGLAGAGLFLFVGVIGQARGSQRIVDISGLWRSHPAFAGLAFGGVASVAAMPGTLGFVGAYQILHSLVGDLPGLAVALGSILAAGGALLWAYRRILGGSHQAEVWTRETWPRRREVGILALLTVALLVAGLLPGLITPSSGGMMP
ncbi:MAG: hypothetical protein JXR96_16510 [Deltaproteobacteria bacterium]|nr:hypothetical protein [Deltaproteobacteria bacterium]